MEQPCYKCGQTVDEGRVFCPHCGAPQIRVLIAEPAAGPSSLPATIQDPTAPAASETVPVLALPIGWSQALKSCALAALVALVLMVLGLYPFVAMPSAGFLAVVFYRQGQQNLGLRPVAAARLGAFSGLLFFGLTAVFATVAAMVPDLRAKLHEQILEGMRKGASSYPADPRIELMLRKVQTPEGFAMLLILLALFLLVVFTLLGGVGGMIAGTIFGRREQP